MTLKGLDSYVFDVFRRFVEKLLGSSGNGGIVATDLDLGDAVHSDGHGVATEDIVHCNI